MHAALVSHTVPLPLSLPHSLFSVCIHSRHLCPFAFRAVHTSLQRLHEPQQIQIVFQACDGAEKSTLAATPKVLPNSGGERPRWATTIFDPLHVTKRDRNLLQARPTLPAPTGCGAMEIN
jgi:hypothetical protein